MVEHTARYPKVKGLSLSTTVRTGEKRWVSGVSLDGFNGRSWAR